ncbi:MAG: phosphatidate cytidylyltransferase [Dermatophilaceae bacterium]
MTFLLAVALIVMWRGSEPVTGAAQDSDPRSPRHGIPGRCSAVSRCSCSPPPMVRGGRSPSSPSRWLSDIGGYAVGVLAGRHPMAPSISPKKSWEGFAGSVAFCMLVGVVCVTLTPLQGPWWAGLVLGALLAPAGHPR